ncbi:MAG TPA: hypothetical protein VGR26_09065 [Acidimicrobiales bacterium]|nr:hypothetical protein [Acidimicrobiales bacterium]
MRRHLGVALLLAVLLAACAITFDDAEQSEEAPVKPVWDLRNSHRIEDVGWPAGHEGSTYKVDPPPGELTILLPKEVTIQGPFDIIANRPLLLEGEVDHGLLEYLVINYDREPVSDAARRAADLTRRWNLDGSELAAWAARNADGRDNSPGGSMASTSEQPLTEDGPFLSIDARALTDGRAYLSVTVFWGNEHNQGEAP